MSDDIVWEDEKPRTEKRPPNWMAPHLQVALQQPGKWIDLGHFGRFPKAKKSSASAYKSGINTGEEPVRLGLQDEFEARLGFSQSTQEWILSIRHNKKEN